MIGLADRPNATTEKREIGIECEDELSFLEEHETHNDRGVAYHLDGQIDSAIAEYVKALRVNPEFAYAHSNLGIAYYALGEIDKAVQEFVAALEIEPELMEVHYNLGTAYKSMGKFDSAIRELLWVLYADPDDADGHLQLGQVYETTDRFDEAIEHYRIYLKLASPRDYEHKKQIEKKIRQLAIDSLLQKCGLQIYQLAAYKISAPNTHTIYAH